MSENKINVPSKKLECATAGIMTAFLAVVGAGTYDYFDFRVAEEQASPVQIRIDESGKQRGLIATRSGQIYQVAANKDGQALKELFIKNADMPLRVEYGGHRMAKYLGYPRVLQSVKPF